MNSLVGFAIVMFMIMCAAGSSYTIISQLYGNKDTPFYDRIRYAFSYELLATFGEFGFDCKKIVEK